MYNLQKNKKSLTRELMVRIAKEEYQNITDEPNITSKTAEVIEFQKDESTVVKCTYEGIGVVNKLPLMVTIYSLLRLKDKVLVITISYPKGDSLEEIKAEKLIQGLKIF